MTSLSILTSLPVLAKQRNNLKNSIKYQVLYYPATEDNFATESYKKFGDGYYLTAGLVKLFFGNYKTEEAKDSILLCPGKATVEDVTGVPPALLVTGEADVLRDGKLAWTIRFISINTVVL